MNPELWQKLDELFHAALEREPNARAAFLAEACGSDHELRQELQSMLAHHEEAKSFIESPAYEVAAETILNEDTSETLTGKVLGSYQVISVLGKGGMGVVYLAIDTQLQRKVALKLLPGNLTDDSCLVQRFKQEARAASALNHPNILTIYEIGELQGRHFIATEFVEGENLRELLRRKRLDFDELLHVAKQIASALAAAHKAAIVHRDIKPENIMVRPDGYVKIVDFGLAKLIERRPADSSLTTLVQTDPGIVMGTTLYMSPEQARAKSTDNPTDIFSLGVVFYELATGRHPFHADTQVDLLHAIVSRQPISPARLNPEIPSTFEALIIQMLRKESGARPTVTEVETTLANLTTSSSGERLRKSFSREKHHSVGREKERAELRESFQSVINGRGVLLCVAGEPGIGKTTLVEDFLGDLTAAGQNYTLARGLCSERLAGAEAYLPFLEALEGLVRDDEGESVVRVMKLVAPTWYALIVPPSAENPLSDQLLADARSASQQRLKRELGALLQEVSQLRPMVLFLDDLHWADVSTVDFLPYLASKFDSMRVMIVATYRPSDLILTKHPFIQAKLDLQARGACREIELDFLSREDVERYLALEFPRHNFPAQFPTVIHKKTEGSPLFMIDLLRYLRDQKVIIEAQGRSTLARPVLEIERELPESVRSMVQRKIDQLSEADRQLLLVASVQGYEFDSAVVARVLTLGAEEVEERLERLDRAHSLVRLVREQEFPDLTLTLHYRFVHVLYQNALYASLTAGRKASLSANVAQVLQNYYGKQVRTVASELALLFEVARDFSRAPDFFLLAARNAARVSANQEAIVLARRGLALVKKLPDTPERAQKELALHITLGVPLMAIKGYGASDVEQTYSRAKELCQQLGESPRLFLIIAGLWAYYMIRAELKTARALAEQGLRLAQKAPTFLVHAHWMLENTLLHLGELVLAQQHSEQGITFYDPKLHSSYTSRYGHDPKVASLSHSSRILWLLGYPDQALQRSNEALAVADISTHRQSQAFALFLAAYLHECRGEWPMTQERSEAAINIARELELANWPTWSTIMRGRALAEQGHVGEGIVLVQESLAALRTMGSEISRPHFLAFLAEALSQDGRVEEGLALLAEAHEATNSTAERYYEAELYRLKGDSLLMQDSSSGEAEACFRQALKIARRQRAKSLELRAATSLSRLLRRQGKQPEARQLLGEIYGWFTEGFDTADLREARLLLEEMSGAVRAVAARSGTHSRSQQAQPWKSRTQTKGAEQLDSYGIEPVSWGSWDNAAKLRRKAGTSELPDGKTRRSLAVLPLSNVSNDTDVEYLSDGITESIINTLSQLPQLRVMARSTVFHYKGKDADPRDVGRELAVQAVMLGRVLKISDKFVITIELVDAANGAQLWGEQYKGTSSDIFTLQEEISKEISAKLQIKLTGAEKKLLTKRHTDNTEAYQLYLRGRYHWSKRTPDELQKGISYFQQAIDLDPDYALAYVGLADSYNMLGTYGVLRPREAMPKAKAAAEKTLSLDATLAEPHISLAYFKEAYEWDWAGAETEFKLAIELNPNYATAHHWYAEYLVVTGRAQQAIRQMKRALELDQFSLVINEAAGWIYYLAHRYDEAIEQYLRTLELDENFVHTHFCLGLAYIQKAEFDKAIAEFHKAINILGRSATPLAGLGLAYALSGKRSEAEALLEELKEIDRRKYVPRYLIALVYTGLGNQDEAFAWLEKSFEEKESGLVWLEGEPSSDRLREDPRFTDLVKRIGIPTKDS